MADTVVSDAAKVPQDEGYPNISDGNETFNSAGLMALLGQAAQSGSYVRSDSELTFASHDGTNDTVDVTAGVAYLSLAGVTVDVQSTQADVNDGAYDTTITTNTMPAVCVVLPSATTVDLQDSTLSSVWLAYDTDGTGPGSAGSVYFRSDDTGSVTAPSHPNVKLGESNPDNAGADVLSNRFSSPTYNDTTTDTLTINNETLVEVEKTADQSYSTSNGVVTVTWDNEVVDKNNDFDLANDQFTPPETGTYHVSFQIITNAAADQNRLQGRWVNATDSTIVTDTRVATSGANTYAIMSSFEKELSAGDNYEVRFQNPDSDDNIVGGSRFTYLTISRSEEN